MGTRTWWTQAVRGHQLLASATLSAVLFVVVTMTADVRHEIGSRELLVYAVTAVVYLVMVVRYRFPALAVAVAATGSVVLIADGMPYPLTLPAVFCTLFTFAFVSSQRRTLAVGVAVKVSLLTAELTVHPGITGFAVVLWAALAVALGRAVGSHRAYVLEVEERARRAELAKEGEANRRVAEERLRIARELHDAIGHHVALISIQAGAMTYLLGENQVEAKESLAHIQRASEQALEDLRLTVGLLREPGDREPVEPVPGLGRLDDLLCSFASAGLRVTREVTGQATPLPEAVDLTAYRVIQESLTNTRKHASAGSAVVRLGYEPGALWLTVEDEGRADGSTGAPGPDGHGIIGMRERVAALGGRLSAGPRTGGGYRVLAELPLSAEQLARRPAEAPAGREGS